MKPAMEFIDIIERSVKPRKTGLTLVRDPGFGMQMLRAHLETIAPFVDYAKARNITPRLFPESLLVEKIQLYRSHQIELFFGGIMFEAAYLQNKVDQAIAYINRLGVKSVEISDNMITLSMAQKLDYVRQYIDAGIEVLYEWGKKYPTEPLKPAQATREIRSLLERGVSKVILEEAEISILLKAKSGRTVLKKLVEAVGGEHIIFETASSEQQVWLLHELGPDVNLGPNLALEEVVWLEPTRRGLGRASGYTALTPYMDKQGRAKSKTGKK
jgi:phosphosulfolactate synthase